MTPRDAAHAAPQEKKMHDDEETKILARGQTKGSQKSSRTASQGGGTQDGNPHTPGPWTVNYVVDGAFEISATSVGDEIVIASRAPIKNRHFEFIANAQLIAAAPDLLAACRKFVDSYKSLQREKCDLAHVLAVAAIRKAEGR